MEQLEKVPGQEGGRQRRKPAGEDPKKRAQILKGAGRVIGRMGYDAASVSDIAREAGVSKGTVYVYFNGKEELFEALIEEVRDQIFEELASELEKPGDLATKLRRHGRGMVRMLCSEQVIRAHRVVIAVSERMPWMGSAFYEKGNARGSKLLCQFLTEEMAAGRLVIEDVSLAATQFFELSMAGLFRRRLFGHMPEEPTEAETARVVDAAVDMFLCRYQVRSEAAG